MNDYKDRFKKQFPKNLVYDREDREKFVLSFLDKIYQEGREDGKAAVSHTMEAFKHSWEEAGRAEERERLAGVVEGMKEKCVSPGKEHVCGVEDKNQTLDDILKTLSDPSEGEEEYKHVENCGWLTSGDECDCPTLKVTRQTFKIVPQEETECCKECQVITHVPLKGTRRYCLFAGVNTNGRDCPCHKPRTEETEVGGNLPPKSNSSVNTPRTEVSQGEEIKRMVSRFLSWKLPKDFNPDAGISFQPYYNVEYMAKQGKPPVRHEPVGTNIFTATQAEEMVRHMLG